MSDQGLLFTNHHCGFGTIQSLSSVEHNYLRDGYWALSLEEELPAPGLSVRFLESFTDVTEQVNKAVAKAKTPADKEKTLAKLEEKLAKKAGCDGKFIVGSINSFYGGNTYYYIVYKVFRDVRLEQQPRRVLREQRALYSETVSEGVTRRLRGGFSRHDYGIPRLDQPFHDCFRAA